MHVRLTGRLDPIDGQYHWQGTVFSSPARPLPDDVLKQSRAATLTVGERSAPARIIEQTPWGTHSVAGVGAPPFALSGHTPTRPDSTATARGACRCGELDSCRVTWGSLS